MELRHLRYFVAIAEERSFTRAAERLWVAQPGLSTQVRRLEAELGVKLLNRHTRGVDLTAAGLLFLERARAALAAADAAAMVGPDLQAGRAGTLRVGVSTGPASSVTAGLLERFSRERPGVELTPMEGYGGTLWRDLRHGALDALIAPAGHCSADLTSMDLGSEPWVVLVGDAHPLAGEGPIDGAALEGAQLAVSGHSDGAVIDRAVEDVLARVGVVASPVRVAPGGALQASLVQGRVIALTTAAAAVGEHVALRPLRPTATLAFQLMWRNETPSAALAEFIRTAGDRLTSGVVPAVAELAVEA